MYRPVRVLLLAVWLAGCAPATPAVSPSPSSSPAPIFFYLRGPAFRTLVLQHTANSSAFLKEIRLAYPSGCTFWSLTPAPSGPYLAIELQCAHGPTVQVVDIRTGQAHLLLEDPNQDSHLLAWDPSGRSVYLKVGALSNPQILLVSLDTPFTEALPISPNTYSIAVGQNGGSILYAFSNGIGLGSELWTADSDGYGARRLLADAGHILGPMRFSPDGQRVAGMRLPDGQAPFPEAEILLMDPDGKNIRVLASADGGHGLPPVWSPDGSKIAFSGRDRPDDPNSTNLSVYDLRTSQVSVLTAPISPDNAPAWSPYNDQLTYMSSPDDKMEVWFYEIVSGKTQKLRESACCAGWLVGN